MAGIFPFRVYWEEGTFPNTETAHGVALAFSEGALLVARYDGRLESQWSSRCTIPMDDMKRLQCLNHPVVFIPTPESD